MTAAYDRATVVIILQRRINAMPYPSIFSGLANRRRGPSPAFCAGGILTIRRAGHSIRPSSRPVPQDRIAADLIEGARPPETSKI